MIRMILTRGDDETLSLPPFVDFREPQAIDPCDPGIEVRGKTSDGTLKTMKASPDAAS